MKTLLSKELSNINGGVRIPSQPMHISSLSDVVYAFTHPMEYVLSNIRR